jgi:uncharacterized protein (DUF2141 family)
MKKLLLLLAVFATVNSYAQPGQRKSPHDTVSATNVSVTYGRPSKNGREVFGTLEKYDKVWRLGADEATTITFAKDVKFDGYDVKAGTYAMFAIPDEEKWAIILNGVPKQWGAFSYEKNKDKDVAKIKVPVNKLDNVVEQLTIRFNKDNAMVIEWDKTQVVVPLKF